MLPYIEDYAHPRSHMPPTKMSIAGCKVTQSLTEQYRLAIDIGFLQELDGKIPLLNQSHTQAMEKSN